MTRQPALSERRQFLVGFLRQQVVEPVVRARDAVREDIRRERFEEVYESELRAFGPDVLANSARRTGIAAEGADYATIAKALADRMANEDDGSA